MSALLVLPLLWVASLPLVLPPAARRLASQGLAGPVIALVLMAVLWQLAIPTLPGLPLHLLGVTAAALVCGPSVAYLQVGVLAVVLGMPGETDWPLLALFCLAAGGLPALVTAGLLRFGRRRLPANVFVFIFVNACVAGAVGMLAYVIVRELALLDDASLRRAFELALLLPLPEAILTGTVIAPLVAFRSRLVRCFDADRYFGPGID